VSPPAKPGAYLAELPGPFGISVNRDSWFYMRAKLSPGYLLQPKEILQSRPLVPMLLHAPSVAASALVPRSQQGRESDPLTGFWGAYLVWLAFNASLVASSAALWLRQVRDWCSLGATGLTKADSFGASTPTTSPALMCAFALLVLFNEVTKAFLLAAHLQMFNLLVPMVCLAAVSEFWEEASSRRLLIWSSGCGVLLLAYGSFAMLGVLLLFVGSRHALKRASSSGSDRIGWPSVIAAAVLMSLPRALWIAVIVVRNGQFYSHELVRWRQIVWIMDTVREQGLPAAAVKWLSNLGFFAHSALRQAAPALGILLATLFLQWPERQGLPVVLAGLRPAFLPLALILATELAFFACVGYRVERLAFSSSLGHLEKLARRAAAQ
jgi:hypothetical protein